MNTKREWLSKKPNEALSKKMKMGAWVFSGVVIIVVGLMNRIHIALPDGVDLSFLPLVYSVMNVLAAIALLAALFFIKSGRVEAHRNAIFVAAKLSGWFLVLYVVYHMTSAPTLYGGEGMLRYVYYCLLVSHIILAAVGLPFILFAFISGFTNHFSEHRKLVRWVFPLWLYVALTGPICYLFLLPYY